MSAPSGIQAAEGLSIAWANAASDLNIRFLKISIDKESLVLAGSWDKENPTLDAEFHRIGPLLEDNTPAYLLARMDVGSSWLFITFIPDTAKVRDKMVYASSRGALTKALGGEKFKDTIFATSKSDISPEGYAAHKRHLAAPKPMSAREKELELIKQAERESVESFEGSRARKSPLGSGVGWKWTDPVETAVKDLANGNRDNLVVITVNPENEALKLHSTKKVEVETIVAGLPTDEPSYSFFAPTPSNLIFIYACPSKSKIKLRMIYSSGVTSISNQGQALVNPTSFKKMETSDPSDLDMGYLKEIIANASSSSLASPGSGSSNWGASGSATPDRGGVDNTPGFTPSNHPFARPRGPARRRP